jgi:hypothetical protein
MFQCEANAKGLSCFLLAGGESDVATRLRIHHREHLKSHAIPQSTPNVVLSLDPSMIVRGQGQPHMQLTSTSREVLPPHPQYVTRYSAVSQETAETQQSGLEIGYLPGHHCTGHCTLLRH